MVRMAGISGSGFIGSVGLAIRENICGYCCPKRTIFAFTLWTINQMSLQCIGAVAQFWNLNVLGNVLISWMNL